MDAKELSDEYFMTEALKQARIAFEENEIPVGAVIVSQNKIIARGYNQIEKLNDVTAHAEMIALTSAFNNLGAKYLQSCTLYVTLEPCIMCAGACNWSQLKKIVIGTKDPKSGFIRKGKDIIHPKTKLVLGVLEEECRVLLEKFFRNVRKK
ncbi:nucleoside deaminase [Bacteroidota bacterium]